MTVGFDVSQTGGSKSGCGHLADALIAHLVRCSPEDRFVLYSAFGSGFWDPDHTSVTRTFDAPHVSRRLANMTHAECKAFWEEPPANLEVRIGRPDVVHSNNFFCPIGLHRARLVYTLYDLVAFDQCDLVTEANRRNCAGGIIEASLRADLMLAISEATRHRFCNLFPHYPADRVKVVHAASRFDARARAADEEPIPGVAPGRFWLFVGTLEPRKNLRRVLSAFARFAVAERRLIPLVVAGGAGWMEQNLGDTVNAMGLEETVRFVGYVTDPALRWLYSNCFGLVYPSLAEGFGLPVVEAMSLGAAVVTSNASSLPEVAGDAALLVPPEDVGALHDAMQRLLAFPELRALLRERARAQAARFSWDRAARSVLAAYTEARDREPLRASVSPRVPRETLAFFKDEGNGSRDLINQSPVGELDRAPLQSSTAG